MKYGKEIAIGLTVVVLGAGGFYAATQMKPSAPAQVQENPNSLENRFEVVLNDFLRDVQVKARAYKSDRKVLGELVKPENLGDATYVQQNYDMMAKLIPGLDLKIDELMLVFEDSEKKVNALLADQPPETAQTVLAEWKEMKQKQSSLYVDYFAIEEQMLTGYEQLMTLYRDKQGAYTVDVIQGTITFTNPEDTAQEAAIKAHLQELARKEVALLGAE